MTTADERLDRIEAKIDSLTVDVTSLKTNMRWIMYAIVPILSTLAGAVVEHILLTGHP